MRARPAVAVFAALLLSASLGGCIAKLVPAVIPAGALSSGWAFDSGNSQKGSAGWGPFMVDYQVNAYARSSSPSGGVYVISVPDVPFYDETARVRDEIKARLDQQGIAATEGAKGETTIGGDKATFQFFALRISQGGGITVDGKSVQVSWTCSATGNTVAVYGFAQTQVRTPLGTSVDLSTWRQVSGETEGVVGGMVAAVQCKP